MTTTTTDDYDDDDFACVQGAGVRDRASARGEDDVLTRRPTRAMESASSEARKTQRLRIMLSEGNSIVLQKGKIGAPRVRFRSGLTAHERMCR